MQKAVLGLVISGILIVVGLMLMVLGNQIVLEGVNQENGKINSEQSLTIVNEFDAETTSIGVFAVQAINSNDRTTSAKIIGPSGNEIKFVWIEQETIEEEFTIGETGSYKLIIENQDTEETQVSAALGPLPDAEKKTIGFISIYVLVVGMAGLVIVGIYAIKNRISV